MLKDPIITCMHAPLTNSSKKLYLGGSNAQWSVEFKIRTWSSLCLQKDSWAVDYQATKNVLDVARQQGTQHFVLLSAICVQKPLLEFQRAKLKLEAELQTADDITYSIVRPTAFFKSLAGQVDSSRVLPNQ